MCSNPLKSWSVFMLMGFFSFFVTWSIMGTNVSKLGSASVIIQNTTSQDQNIRALFYKKCSGCPRLRFNHEKVFSIGPMEKVIVSDSENNIIKDLAVLLMHK